MNHGSNLVAGKDCAACHAADAQKTGSAWSKLDIAAQGSAGRAHLPGVSRSDQRWWWGRRHQEQSTVGAHQLDGGDAASATTGVAAGTLSQITHSDVNAANRDCNFCHTQAGIASSAALAGQEWAQARFHASFREHGAGAERHHRPVQQLPHEREPQDVVSHVQPRQLQQRLRHPDCSGCHSYPGTGTAGAPNWLGGSTVANK